jgi:hypothetical protein
MTITARTVKRSTLPPRKRHETLTPLKQRKDQAPHLQGDIKVHQTAFLTVYRVTGNITHSARAVGFRRNCVFDWERFDSTWAERFAEAKEEASDRLEEAARVRAVDGVKQPVYTPRGELAGYTTQYSDRLLQILLKANRPGKFGDKVSVDQHTVIDLQPVLSRLMTEIQDNDQFLEFCLDRASNKRMSGQDSNSSMLRVDGNSTIHST